MPALLAALLFVAQEPRLAGATRTDVAGWICAHLEGEPRDIGFQYGTLLSKEIDDAHQALRWLMKRETGKDWTWFRDNAKSLFWDRLDPEYQEEIAGQAEGLKAKGLPYDQWDVLAFNGYIELEEYYIPWLQKRPSNKTSCSAFVATGSATKDGKVVMGHNLWWDYLMGQRFNAMLDIQPKKGHRIVMDALCGFIHSGSDFAINDAGILVTETTIAGFAGFDPKGVPEFMRMRKATQYASSLDEWVATMKAGNNGGYANTWLLADTKTNEIGRLELGLKNVIFERKKDGAFVGSNFPESQKLIAEEVPGGWDGDPRRNSCETRRARWRSLLEENVGKVDADMAKGFLADTFDINLGQNQASDSTLCGRSPNGGAVNTKVVTSEMAAKMEVWARMGFSDGYAKIFRGNKPPLLRDIPTQPWVLLKR